MLIPAALSLIISTIFLNLNFSVQSAWLISDQGEPTKIGKVLGVGEINGVKKIIEQNNNFNRAIVKAIGDTRALSVPQFLQLPQLDQPMHKFTNSRKNQPARLATAPAKRAGGLSATADYDFSAENGVILDYSKDGLFFAKRPDRPWPIASITKLFTAYAFLDYNPGWGASYEVKAEDKREGGKIYLFTGDKVTVKDLFYFSLVGSDNTATAALVRSTGLSEAEFVAKMNAKIKELGFKNTRFLDPAGLKDGNISTAREVALFARIALAKEEISRASLTKTYEFYTKQGRKKKIANTNELLNSFPNEGISILGGKTGHVDSSGYCLVGQFKNSQGQIIVTVVLGADSDSSRFGLTKKLVALYYKNRP